MSNLEIEAKKVEIEKELDRFLEILVEAKTVMQRATAKMGALAQTDPEVAKAMVPKLSKTFQQVFEIITAMSEPEQQPKTSPLARANGAN